MEVFYRSPSIEPGILFQNPFSPPPAAAAICMLTDQSPLHQLTQHPDHCPAPKSVLHLAPSGQPDDMSADAVVSRVARGADLDAIRSILSKRPITTNSITNPAFDPATIQRDAQETRIVVHRRYPQLVKEFLRHKRYHGSSVEKRLYSAHDWTWEKQVARLSELRRLSVVTFMVQ